MLLYAADTAKVGALGSGSRMFFEGNKTFTAEDLHHSLRTHGDWLPAAQIIARLTTKQKKPEDGSSTQRGVWA